MAMTIGLVVPAVALEAGLRAAEFHHIPLQKPFLVWNAKQDQKLHDDQSLHHMDLDLLWAPRPGVQVSPQHDELIGESGLRGFDLDAWESTGALRLASLGDSSTFGWGVVWEDTWTAQAAGSLASDLDSPNQIATLGGGVIGHTVVQGRQRYLRDVSERRPDVVVMAYGAVNDHFASDIPDPERIAALRRREGWRNRTWKLAVQTFRVVQGMDLLVEELRGGRQKLWNQLRDEVVADLESQVGFEHAEYTGMRRVPLELFEAEYLALIESVRADGGLPVLLRMPRRSDATAERSALGLYDRAIERIAAEADVLLVDASDVIAVDEEQELFFDPYHPKPEGHRRIGERVAQAIAPLLLERSSSDE